jgi:hypothetical protein
VKLKLKTALLKLKAGDWRAVGIESSNAVLSTLGEVSGSGGVSPTLEQMMRGLPPESKELQSQIQKFLSRCEILSFAPQELSEHLKGGGGPEMKNVITEAEKIISDLFDLDKREKSSTPANASPPDQKTS